MIDDPRSAERHAGRDRDDRVLVPPFARDLLVRLADVNDFGDARKRLDARAVDAAVVADEADRGARLARHRARRVAHLFYGLDDAVDLLRRRVILHDNQHYISSISKCHPSDRQRDGTRVVRADDGANVDALDGRIEVRERQMLVAPPRQRARRTAPASGAPECPSPAEASTRTRADRIPRAHAASSRDGPVSPV